MCLEGKMKITVSPNQGNKSEVGDLKAGLLEYKAEAQFQPLHSNVLFSRLELKFYNFLNIHFFKVSRSTLCRTDT
jgi:hypothetical protein